MNANASNLARLNAYRAAQGLDPVKDFRPARHQQFLNTIVAPWEAMIAAEQAKEKIDAHTKKVLAKIKDEKGKPESYKHLARKSPKKSSLLGPVNFVHAFLDANPTMGRKVAIAALIGAGVNFSTARTQYQKWFAANKKTGA